MNSFIDRHRNEMGTQAHTMKQAVKFTFDTYFGDGPKQAHRAPDVEMRVTEADVENARKIGYAEGFDAGEREAAARADESLANSIRQLAESSAALLAALDSQIAISRKEAVSVALEAARKLAPALIATRPEAEIEAVLRECLSHLNREPHILLRVSVSLVEGLKETVDRMAMERGLAGRIILLGEPALQEGDCVVEWADGGVVRNREEIAEEITGIVARYIETLSPAHGDADALAMPEPSRPAQAQS